MGSRERTNSTREYLLVVDIALYPTHHLLDIRWRGHLCGPLVVLIVLPKVLEFVRRLHLGARLRRAEFRDGAVEEVDLVVEVHHCASLSVFCIPSCLLKEREQRTVDG